MVNVPIPQKSYRIYEKASRRIVRQLGAKAPSAEALIRHELSSRNPDDVIQEYQDFLREKERRMRRPERRTVAR